METKQVISAKPILFLLQIANQTGFSTDYIYREMQNIFSVPKYTREAQYYSFNISDAIQKSVYDALLSSGFIEKRGENGSYYSVNLTDLGETHHLLNCAMLDRLDDTFYLSRLERNLILREGNWLPSSDNINNDLWGSVNNDGCVHIYQLYKDLHFKSLTEVEADIINLVYENNPNISITLT